MSHDRRPSAPAVDRTALRRGSVTRAVVVVLAMTAVTWAAFTGGRNDPARPPRAAPGTPAATERVGAYFTETAGAAGIDFRMAFLPAEQGETFKINLYDHGCGVAVADVDGDGDDDVYFCNQLGPNALYRNDGGFRFTDVTPAAGVAVDDRISVCASFADVDADGDPDLYVATTRGGNVMFRNRGDGTFEDVTASAGLALVAHSQGVAFFDADGDGAPDLLVTNTAAWTTPARDPSGRYHPGAGDLFDLVDSPPEANVFYRNRGDGTFVDATAASGLAGVGWGGDVAAFDADDDGDLDVFVANMFGRSTLYRNDGRGHFTDATAEMLGGASSFGTVGARAFDQDVDGRLDLFLVDMHSDMWLDAMTPPDPAHARRKFPGFFGPREDPDDPLQRRMLGKMGSRPDGVVFGNTLFKGLGHGRFVERSEDAGAETWWPWGIAVGDFDLDGAEDVFVPAGMGFPFEFWPPSLLMNDGHGRFDDRAADAGLDPADRRMRTPGIRGRPIARSGRSAATADFDGDGRLDLVVNAFNGPAEVYRNDGPRRTFVSLRLVGDGKNRDAVGALVRVTAGGRTRLRQVQAAGGYLAQSSAALHFGLGDARTIDACVIRWPDGTTQDVGPLPVDRVHVIRQPSRTP